VSKNIDSHEIGRRQRRSLALTGFVNLCPWALILIRPKVLQVPRTRVISGPAHRPARDVWRPARGVD